MRLLSFSSFFTEAFFAVICLPTLKLFESTRKQLWNISCKKEKHVFESVTFMYVSAFL